MDCWLLGLGGFALGVLLGALVATMACGASLHAKEQELAYYRAKAHGRARS